MTGWAVLGGKWAREAPGSTPVLPQPLPPLCLLCPLPGTFSSFCTSKVTSVLSVPRVTFLKIFSGNSYSYCSSLCVQTKFCLYLCHREGERKKYFLTIYCGPGTVLNYTHAHTHIYIYNCTKAYKHTYITILKCIYIYIHFIVYIKNLPAMQETQVWSLGWEDPLEKEMASHSSVLGWKISWTEEPGGL